MVNAQFLMKIYFEMFRIVFANFSFQNIDFDYRNIYLQNILTKLIIFPPFFQKYPKPTTQNTLPCVLR